MENIVKIEVEDFTYLQEATVDDVYVDIDGAVEEAEKYMHTDADVKPVVTDMKIKRERISPLPWQRSENTSFTDVQKRFSFDAGQDVKFDPLTKKSSARNNQSDEEIDVDTPYLEKLRGQTGSKAETIASCRSSSLGLGLLNSGFSCLLGSKVIRQRKANPLFCDKDEISETSWFSQKESNCQKKSGARKSTTTRVTSKKTSNVSKKSTSKQSKPARMSNYNAKANVPIKLAAKQSECSEREPNNNTVPLSDFSSRLPSKHAVSNLGEQVKRSSLNVARKSTSKQAQPSVAVSSLPSQTLNCSEMARQSPLKTHELASSQNAESHNVEHGMSSGLDKGPGPAPSLCSNEVSSSEKSQSTLTHPSASHSQDLLPQPKTTFAFVEKSSKIIACPECGVETVQWRLKDHLKTVHDLQLNTCTKCKIGFTDVNQYSEHYAFHLQQEENHIAKILRSPINAGFTRQRLTREQRRQWVTKRKLSAMGVQQSNKASSHSICDTSSEAVRHEDSVRAVPKSPSQHIPSPVKRSQRLKFKTRRAYPFSSSFYQNSFVHSNYPKVKASYKIHQKGFASSRTEQGYTSSHSMFERTKPSVKTTQSTRVRTCAKCKKDFTDLNQYSEHVAFHLQQEENWKAGIKRSPSKNVFVNQQVSLEADYAKSDEDSQFTAQCRNDQFYAKNPKVFSMSRPCGPQSFDQSVSCSSPQSEVSSCFDEIEKDNASTALLKEIETTEFQRRRRSRTSSSSHDMCSPPSKRQRLEECVDDRETCTVSGNSCSKATVCIVSLEAAAQPFNCKMCLQAFHTALACPESFRQYFQDKLSADNLEEGSAAQFSPSSSYQDSPSSLYSVEDADEETETRENEDDETVGVAPSNVCLQQEVTHSNRIDSPKKGGARKSGGYECNVCHDIFQDHSDLLKHAPYHSYQFACGFCCKAYQEKVDLFDHFEIAHGGKMEFRCKYCERRFEDLIHFHTHIKTHKDGTIVRCTECNQKFSSSQQMLLHVKNCHGPCEVCGEKFLEEKLFLEHLRTAHRKQSKPLQPVVSKRLSCRMCARVFQTLTGLLSHKRSHHRISSSSKTEVTHSRVSTASSKKGKTSPSPSREKRLPLQLHSNVSSTHSVTDASGTNDAIKQAAVVQKCRKCGKTFGGNLGKAFSAHTKLCHAKQSNSRETSGEAVSIPKKCILCQKTFAWRKSLVRHMVVCHQLTKEELSLNMNGMKNRKLEVKPKAEKCSRLHLCKICKECFTVEKSFKLHQVNRHKGKSGFFQCRFCKKYLTRHFTLGLHLQRQHQGRPPFLCRGCHQEFNTSEAVLAHSCCTDSLKGCREENAESDHETPQISVKKEDPEYRYKCGACNIGFYIAHEWTKHMQKHFNNGEDSDNSEIGQTIPECEEQINSSNTERSGSFSCQSSDVDECIVPDTCDHSEKLKTSTSLSSEREEETSQGDCEFFRTAGSAVGSSQSLDIVKKQGQIVHHHFTCQNTDKTFVEEKVDIVQENGGTSSSVELQSTQESVAYAPNLNVKSNRDESNKLCYNSQINSQDESSLGAFEDWYAKSLISEYLANTDTSFTHTARRSVQETEITTENTSESKLESTSPTVRPQSSEDRCKEVAEDHDALDDKLESLEHDSSGEKRHHVETAVQNWPTADDNQTQKPTLLQEKPVSDEQPMEVCKPPVLINETQIVDMKISGEQGEADQEKAADRNAVEETTAVVERLNEAQKDLNCSTLDKAGSKILQSLKIKHVFMCQICKIFEDGSSVTRHKCDTFDCKNSTVSEENLSIDFLQTSSETSVKLSETTDVLNSRNSESNESLGEKSKRLEDEPVGESKRPQDEQLGDSKRPQDEQLGDSKRLEDEQLGDSKRPQDEQLGDSKRPQDEQLGDSKRLEDEQLGDSKRPQDEQLGDSKRPQDEQLGECTKKPEDELLGEGGKRQDKQLDKNKKRQEESDAQTSCKETTHDKDSDAASCEYPNSENPNKESIEEDALTAVTRGSFDMHPNQILNRSDEMEQDQPVGKKIRNSRNGGADLEKQIGELHGTTLDSQEMKLDCKAEDFKDHKHLMSHSMEKCVAVLKSKLGSRCHTKQLRKGEQTAQNSEGASTCPVQSTQETYTADVKSVKYVSKGLVDEGRKVDMKRESRRPNIFDVISSKNAFSCDVAEQRISKDEDLFSQNHESVLKEPNDIHLLSTCKVSVAKEVIDHSCEEIYGAETVGKTRQIYIPTQNSWNQSCETSRKTCGITSASPKCHDQHYPDDMDIFDEETDDSTDQSPVGKGCDQCADDGDSPAIRPSVDVESQTSADLNLISLTESKGEEREGDDKVCFDTNTATQSHDSEGQLHSEDCMDVTLAREDETHPEKCVHKYREESEAELSMNETLSEEEGVHVLSSVISEDRDEKETCEEKPVQTVQGNLATAELCMDKGSSDSATIAGAKLDQRPNIFDMLSLDTLNCLVCKEPYTAQHLHSECYRVPLEESKSVSTCNMEQERTSKEKSPEETSVVLDSNDSEVKVLDAVEGKHDGECDETGTMRRRSNDLSDYLPVGLYIRKQCNEPQDQEHSEDVNSTQNSSVEPDLSHPQNYVPDKSPLCAMEKQKGNILNDTGDSPKGNEDSTVMGCAERMNGSEMNDVAERMSTGQRTHFNSDEGISRKSETVKSESLARPVTLEAEQNQGTARNQLQNEPWNSLNKKEPISAVVVERKTRCIPVLQNVQKLMSRIRRKSSLRQGKRLGENKKEPHHIDKNAGRDTLETQDRKVGESTLVNENQAETSKLIHRFGDGDNCEKQDHRSNIFDILSVKTASTSQAVLQEPANKNNLGIRDSCSLLSDKNLSHSPFHALNGTSKPVDVNKEPTDSVQQTLTSDYGIFSVLSGTLTEGSKNLDDNDSSSVPKEVSSTRDNQAESELRKQLTQLLLNSQLNSQQGLSSDYLSDSSVNSSSSKGDRPDEPCVAHMPVKTHRASDVNKTAQMKGPFEILQDYLMKSASVSQPEENLGLQMEAQHNVESSKPVHEVKSLEEKDNSTCRSDDQLGKVNQKQTQSARKYLENLRKKVTLDNAPYRRKESRRIHTVKGSKHECVSVSQDENVTDNRHEHQTVPVHSGKSTSPDSDSRGAGVMSSATDRRQNIFDVLLENGFT